jgi:hypothetical protein
VCSCSRHLMRPGKRMRVNDGQLEPRPLQPHSCLLPRRFSSRPQLKMLARTEAEITKARGLQPDTVRSCLSRLVSRAGIRLEKRNDERRHHLPHSTRRLIRPRDPGPTRPQQAAFWVVGQFEIAASKRQRKSLISRLVERRTFSPAKDANSRSCPIAEDGVDRLQYASAHDSRAC